MNKIKILRRSAYLLATLAILGLSACTDQTAKYKAVFLLLDTSGTYTREIEKAQAIVNYLLSTLNSGDSIAVARIDSGSFSEKDIIAKASFSERPSMANNQKRLFKKAMDDFVNTLERGSPNTDITGGIVQAAHFVNETQAGQKTILIFSDLEEDLPEGHIREFPIDVEKIQVVALNVTKLTSDNIDPREYQNRLDYWQGRVEQGGGEWRILNDLERIEKLL